MNQWDKECVRRYQKRILECQLEISGFKKQQCRLEADIKKFEQLIEELTDGEEG